MSIGCLLVSRLNRTDYYLFKDLNGLAPGYLKNYLLPYEPAHFLRSLLIFWISFSECMRPYLLYCSAPIWNLLPWVLWLVYTLLSFLFRFKTFYSSRTPLDPDICIVLLNWTFLFGSGRCFAFFFLCCDLYADIQWLHWDHRGLLWVTLGAPNWDRKEREKSFNQWNLYTSKWHT